MIGSSTAVQLLVLHVAHALLSVQVCQVERNSAIQMGVTEST